MGILSRIFKVGEAEVNRVIDKAERPEVMLEQALRDQKKQLSAAKQAVASVMASAQETSAKLNEERRLQAEWEENAKSALKAGKDELAEKALTRAEEHEQNAASLEPTVETQKKEIEGLRAGIRKMENEIQDLNRNKDLLIAQSKAAEAKKSIYAARAKIGKNDTGDLIDRMKKKAQRNAFEAQAAEELAEDGGDELEKEFASLKGSSASASVREKLAAMKGEIK